MIVPAYNEAATIRDIVGETLAAMDASGRAFEIIVVEDGSADGTADAVASLADAGRIRLLRHATNQGAGMAIRTGFGAATGDLVLYIPADGQFDPAEIPVFADAADASGADIVVGVRRDRAPYGAWRRLQSRAYLAIVNLVFRQNFRDVNWVHLWRRRSIAPLPLRARGVFMQQELLARAARLGLAVVEIESDFRRRAAGVAKGSKPSVVVKTLAELFAFLVKR